MAEPRPHGHSPPRHEGQTWTPARLLVTGFGPFPGVPQNISAGLAADVAARLNVRCGASTAASALLPTEWGAAVPRLHAALAATGAQAALHLGVASRLGGLAIERFARREVSDGPDAAGLSAGRPTAGPKLLAGFASAVAGSLADRVRRHGLACTLSTDAGGYLCNAVYYASLKQVHAGRPLKAALFIHVPAHLPGRSRHAVAAPAAPVGSFAVPHPQSAPAPSGRRRQIVVALADLGEQLLAGQPSHKRGGSKL